MRGELMITVNELLVGAWGNSVADGTEPVVTVLAEAVVRLERIAQALERLALATEADGG
jgi:hypothetical protein